MSYYADPDSWGSCDPRTDDQLRRDAAALDALLADPANLAAFVATARHTAGGSAEVEIPGPA